MPVVSLVAYAILSILVATLSLGHSDSNAAPAAASEQHAQLDGSTAPAAKDNSEALLLRFNKLADGLQRLKTYARDKSKLDRMAVLEFAAKLQLELYVSLDQLLDNLHQREEQGADAGALHASLETLVSERSSIIRAQIASIRKLQDELRSKGVSDQGIARKDLLRWLNNKIEQMQDHQIALMVANVARMEQLKMPADDDQTYLDELLPRRAIELSGRISLALDTINTLKQWLENASPEEQKTIEQQLRTLEFQKNSVAESLSNTLEMMQTMGIETSHFGQILVLATGELLNKTVDTKVAIGVLQKVWRSVRLWLDDNLSEIIVRLSTFLLILLAFKLLAKVVSRVLLRVISRSTLKTSRLLSNFVQGITSKVIILVGFIVALTQLGIELGPLLAGLGIMGCVVGFALQDTLSNFASGMMILVTRPFDIDDVIDAGGVNGIVRSMNLISTTIVPFDNQQIVVPNSKVWGSTIRNVSAQDKRRVDLSFTLSHQVDSTRMETLFKEVIDADQRVLEDPAPTIKLNKVGEYSSEFIVRPWVRSEDYWSFYWDTIRAIKDRLDNEELAFVHRQQDVHVQYPDKSSPLVVTMINQSD
jgi:small conductance mechanosensitive channel